MFLLMIILDIEEWVLKFCLPLGIGAALEVFEAIF